MSDSLPLSVVVVGRNEGDHLETCLDTVFDLCRDGPDFEVLYVDSNSTDDSVACALDYPVTVLRIPSDDLCSPAAGRYVGARRARGERVLFVDGDMTVEPGWLSAALDALDRPDVAGVTGHLDARGEAESPHDVDALRGVALYDADRLDAVGGFDPFLQASEDVDVGFRLLAAGHRLVRLPRVVATHPSASGVREPVRRWRNGYFRGVGQAVRNAASDRSPSALARHAYVLRHTIAVVCWLAVGALALLVGRRAALAWGATSALGFAFAARSVGVARPLYTLVAALLTAAGVASGARSPTPAPDDYPLGRVETVRREPS